MQSQRDDTCDGTKPVCNVTGAAGTCPFSRDPPSTLNQDVVEHNRRFASKGSPPRANADRNVFLFLPNVVGYLRVLLLLAAVGFAEKGCHTGFLASYLTSQLLDAVDGEVARRFNQVSVFGACFDQLIDRLSTCVLYILNAVAYPCAASALIAALLTDIGGHWLLFFSSAVAGARSHKQLEPAANPILRLYYSSRPVMVAAIVGYESFFVLLLTLRHHTLTSFTSFFSSPLITAAIIAFWLSVPGMLFKALTNVLQLAHGSKRLAKLDVAEKTD